MIIQFSFPEAPVPKGRPRFKTMLRCVRCQRYYVLGKSKTAICPNCTSRQFNILTSTYTPQKTKDFERMVAWECRKVYSGKPLEGACALSILAYYKYPKSWTKKQINKVEADGGILPKATRPDCDNIEKAITDALNEVVYKDDKQIYRSLCRKYYAIENETVVTVTFPKQ